MSNKFSDGCKIFEPTYEKIKDLRIHLYEEGKKIDGYIIKDVATLEDFINLIVPVIKQKLNEK